MKAIIIYLAILSLLSVSNEKKIRFLAAGLGGMGGLSNACNIVDKICLMWRSICGAFATVKSSYLKEILIKDGFDHYSGTTTLQYSVGVKEDRFERFALRLAGKREFLSHIRRILLLFFLKQLIWILRYGVNST